MGRQSQGRPCSASLMCGCFRSISCAALLGLLVCVVTLPVAGCGGKERSKQQTLERYSEKLREAVSANVADQGRKAQMLLIVDKVEALHRRFSQETTDFIESYRKLNADYEASRPAFDQLFSDYSAKRIEARSEALDLHFQLASLATEDEWHAIGKAEIKLYEEVNAARSVDGSKK